MKIRESLLLLPAAMLAFCAAPQPPSHLDRLRPCASSAGLTDAYCGAVNVWEDRAAQSGRRIALNVVVLPALKQKNAPDPLFILVGGPGQAATEFADHFEDQFRSIRTARDIVLVDQRGTGKSNSLDCRKREDSSDESAELVPRMRECLASISGKADVTKYTTAIAMDDLDDVREFLGYSRIDLYGASYGTRAAIVYAERHADHTRAVVLDGVAPADIAIPLYLAKDSQRALDLLLHDCENDARCNQRFPNLRARLAALLDRLSVHPEQMDIADARTGLVRRRVIDRSTIARTLLGCLYVPALASTLPLLIEEAEKNNFSGFFAMEATLRTLSETVARGMQMSVICSEDAPQIQPGAIEREAAGTFLGPGSAAEFMQVCAFWPRAASNTASSAKSPANVPALILSGQLDPATPPWHGQEIASVWKRSRHIIVPATGHGTASSGCVMKLIEDFLNAGDASALDAQCVQKFKRPPFFDRPSGPDAGSQ